MPKIAPVAGILPIPSATWSQLNPANARRIHATVSLVSSQYRTAVFKHALQGKLAERSQSTSAAGRGLCAAGDRPKAAIHAQKMVTIAAGMNPSTCAM